MSELRKRMIEDMQLHGYAQSTQNVYLGTVQTLARHYDRPPDQLSEEQIRAFFLNLINDKQIASSTLTIYLCGIKFFYESTLKRQWPIFGLIHPKKRKKMPVILALEEVRHFLSRVRRPVARMCLTMIYSCGLRPSEGAHLQVDDIDSQRMMVRIRNGKGGKDRYVPLPQRTLQRLREYWLRKRPRTWLFPSSDPQSPIILRALQRTMKRTLRECGIRKQATVHTLRHCYATHLLEAGIDLRTIQDLLGHRSLRTTYRYAHLTRKSIEKLNATLNHLMADL